MRISLTVNGERREADLWGGESLLTVLRDTLELPGSKNACEQGECGSCSVLLDGEPTRSNARSTVAASPVRVTSAPRLDAWGEESCALDTRRPP